MTDLEHRLKIPVLSESDISRFWSKVAVASNKKDCWNWTGSKRRRGYGRFAITVSANKDVAFIASRLSYFINNKVDPANKIVLHSCDNTSCVNPNHLSLGTFKDNIKDMMYKGGGANQFIDGEGHIGSKLTEDIVRDIRNGKYSGLTQKQIGGLFNVDASSICNVLRFRNWKHVKNKEV